MLHEYDFDDNSSTLQDSPGILRMLSVLKEITQKKQKGCKPLRRGELGVIAVLFITPLQGFTAIDSNLIGRCPMLDYEAPSGLECIHSK